MARNQGPPSEDPPYRHQAGRNSFADDALPLDAGLTDDDGEDDQPQFRRAKRVPVRRGALPRKAASRVRNVAVLLLSLAALSAATYGAYGFALHSWRFRVRSDSDIELAGDSPNSRAQVLEKMHEAIGQNVFQTSLAERKRELEKLSWVESASVIRLWPNHLRVMVKERNPVAFVELGGRIELIDAHGVLMEVPTGQSEYSFPVIMGMSESEPLSTRAPRMRIFTRLIRELDGGDGSTPEKVQYSRNLDEVNLSDPEDVEVVVKGGSGPILLHLGNENFLPRFQVFLSNVQKWEQDRGKLESVDLRYGREVILKPDTHAAPPAPPVEAVKAAAAPQKQPPAKKSKRWHQPPKKRK